MMRLLSIDELKEKSVGIFKSYGVEVLYCTADGNFFLRQAQANGHAQLKNLKIIKIELSDLPKKVGRKKTVKDGEDNV